MDKDMSIDVGMSTPSTRGVATSFVLGSERRGLMTRGSMRLGGRGSRLRNAVYVSLRAIEL